MRNKWIAEEMTLKNFFFQYLKKHKENKIETLTLASHETIGNQKYQLTNKKNFFLNYHNIVHS